MAGGLNRAVEIFQAFCWTCDDCGRDNFERAIAVSPEEIDPENLPDAPWQDNEAIREWLESCGRGDWFKAPSRVRCRFCAAEFSAVGAQ